MSLVTKVKSVREKNFLNSSLNHRTCTNLNAAVDACGFAACTRGAAAGPLGSAGGTLEGAHPTARTGALCVYTTVSSAPLSASVVVLSAATVKLAFAASSVNCVFADGPPAAGAGAGAASGCAPVRSGCARCWVRATDTGASRAAHGLLFLMAAHAAVYYATGCVRATGTAAQCLLVVAVEAAEACNA